MAVTVSYPAPSWAVLNPFSLLGRDLLITPQTHSSTSSSLLDIKKLSQLQLKMADSAKSKFPLPRGWGLGAGAGRMWSRKEARLLLLSSSFLLFLTPKIGWWEGKMLGLWKTVFQFLQVGWVREGNGYFWVGVENQKSLSGLLVIMLLFQLFEYFGKHSGNVTLPRSVT